MELSIKHNFYQIMPGIFLIEVDGNNDLGMTFLRAQEFYESVNPNIQFSKFTIEQYSQWYKTQSKTGDFSYGEDWRGFNLPSHAIEACYRINNERTAYDDFFLSIVQKCKELAKNDGLENYYLLGVRKDDTQTLDHEVAHGMFTVNEKYQKQMLERVNRLSNDVKYYLYNWLTHKGYSQTVHNDEIQAYMSTGLNKTMEHKLLAPYSDEFKEVFNIYVGEVKLGKPIHCGIN